MLVPREHGAYGQLLSPILSALLIGRPAAAAYLLSVAATAAFLGHESLLVLLGQRGGRAAREQRAEAWRSLMRFGGLALATGVASLAMLPADLRITLLIPATLATLVAVMVARGRERTTLGEVVVAAALSSVSIPVARAGGTTEVGAWTLSVVFAAVFATATVAVRALIGRTARAGGPTPLAAGLVTVGAIAALGVLASQGTLASIAPYAALPVALVAFGLTLRPPSPRHLRTVGWTLVGATAASAVMLVVGLA